MEQNYIPLFWAIVEIFGHNVLAGQVGEQTIGGESFLRIDVPGIDEQEPFTKYYGRGAIFSITPTDEQTVLAALRGLRPKPIDLWKLNLNVLLPERLERSDEEEEF